MNEKDFIKEFEKRKKFYLEIENNKEKNLAQNIYLHEARNSIHSISEALKIGITIPEIIQAGGIESLEKLAKLEPAINFNNFSRNELKSKLESDLYDSIKKDTDFYNKNYGLEFKIENNRARIKMDPSVLYTFFSTHLGDAAKWSPEGEKIEIKLNQDKERIYFEIKNLMGFSPQRKSIGLGEGLGTKYSNLLINVWGGKIETINKTGNPYNIFEKKINLLKK